MTKVLPLLTAAEPGHPSFHVVAPSIPGYGWSEGASNRGFRSRNYAEVGQLQLPYLMAFTRVDKISKLLNKLMLSLGYSEYVTQGGDWGYFVRCYTFLITAETDQRNCLLS